MKQIVADKNLIAFCGLYCGACIALSSYPEYAKVMAETKRQTIKR